MRMLLSTLLLLLCLGCGGGDSHRQAEADTKLPPAAPPGSRLDTDIDRDGPLEPGLAGKAAQETGGQFVSLQVQPLLDDDGIPLAVMGILVVFAALVLVSVFISLLPRIMPALAHYFPEHEEPHAAITAPPGSEDELAEEELVVIAAAVAEVVKEPHRIIHTRELTPVDLAWSLEGRRHHHSSHKTKTRDRW